jgi:hypothetical protein
MGIVLFLLAGSVGPVMAQTIGPPSPTSGGIFGSRRTQSLDLRAAELTLLLDLIGGHNQQPIATETSPSVLPLFNPTGYLGTGMANLTYRKGWTWNSLEAAGSASINHNSTVQTDRIVSSDVRLQWNADVGRRNGLTLGLNASHQPATLFNSYGPVADQVDPQRPGVVVQQAVTAQAWLNADATGGFFRNWTRRQRMDLRVITSSRQPLDGPGLTSRTHAVTYTHQWSPRQGVVVRPAYRYSYHGNTDELGQNVPLQNHGGELAITLTRRLSPSRQLSIGGGVGVTHTQYEPTTGAYTFDLPTYSGTARLQLTRGWSIAADAGRNVTVLEGLSPEPFTTKTVAVRSESLIGRRLNFVLSSGYSRGAGSVSTNGVFKTVEASAYAQFALGRHYALYGGYAHYDYEVTSVGNLQSVLPTRYQVNSVRFGVSLWLPLYGRF